MANSKKTFASINIILIAQLSLMLILSLLITKTITDSTKENAIEHMNTIADEQSKIIDTYIENAEKTLSVYSNASDIRDIVLDPDNKQKQEAAQKYTESFSKDISNLEGIYVSTWDTQVRAHTNTLVIGYTTRIGESLNNLHELLLNAGNEVYNAGIIMSPVGEQQIISIYKAIYDEKSQPVGFVGLGIYISDLIESLDSLKIKGMENFFYSMVNVADNKYIFNKDHNMLYKEATNSSILELCEKYSDSASNDTGYFEYNENSKKFISIYSYIGKRGWLLMIDDTKNEMFALTKSMTIYLIVFCLTSVAIITLFSFIKKNKKKQIENYSQQ